MYTICKYDGLLCVYYFELLLGIQKIIYNEITMYLHLQKPEWA